MGDISGIPRPGPSGCTPRTKSDVIFGWPSSCCYCCCGRSTSKLHDCRRAVRRRHRRTTAAHVEDGGAAAAAAAAASRRSVLSCSGLSRRPGAAAAIAPHTASVSSCAVVPSGACAVRRAGGEARRAVQIRGEFLSPSPSIALLTAWAVDSATRQSPPPNQYIRFRANTR